MSKGKVRVTLLALDDAEPVSIRLGHWLRLAVKHFQLQPVRVERLDEDEDARDGRVAGNVPARSHGP